MAIFHMSAKTVSRGKGQSAIAKAAYNSRDQIRDEQTGQVKDYARTAGLMFSAIFAPQDAPAWTHDRAALWNAVELAEKRKDAQLAREITLGLPHELTDQQRKQLVTDFVREQFQRKGMVADVNIHAPGGKGDDRNYHAHILLTMREVGPEGFGPKAREWNSREQLENWREAWERTQNRYLERHGHEARVDRRTLEAQGIDREPTTHLGPHAHGMEQRKGIETERGNIHRDTFTSEQETAKLKRELALVERQIAAAVRETAKAQPRETRAGENQQQSPASRFQEAARATTQRGKEVQPSVPRPARTVANDNRQTRAVAKRGAGKAVSIGAGVLHVATDLISSLFAPPTPKTAAQIEQDNKRQENAAELNAAAHQQEVSEAEYDRTKERWAKEAQEREQRDKDFKRYQGDDRDRDRL
jgi:ATP-dependent exoDNAse (exonuclease V) alpha subunit